MDFTIIDVVQSIILPSVTVILGYFGWRATAEKNKLKAEVEGMKASNTSKEIDNQMNWIDLYKKLHDDQAYRLTQAEKQILELKKTIYKFENAFKKYHSCPYFATCPIQRELSRGKGTDKPDKGTKRATSRQREPPRETNGETDNNPSGDS